ERAHRFAMRGFRPRPMPMDRTRPGEPGTRVPTAGGWAGGGPPAPGPGAFPGPAFPRPRPEGFPAASAERGPQGWPFDAEAERRASFLRPRFLDLHGQGLPPFSARG